MMVVDGCQTPVGVLAVHGKGPQSAKYDQQQHLKHEMSLCGFEPQLTNLEFIVYPPKLKSHQKYEKLEIA